MKVEDTMRAEDILPDNETFVKKDGALLRKGSVAAFIANAKILLDSQSSLEECAIAEKDLIDLIPTLKAVGLFDIFEVKSEKIKKLIAD